MVEYGGEVVVDCTVAVWYGAMRAKATHSCVRESVAGAHVGALTRQRGCAHGPHGTVAAPQHDSVADVSQHTGPCVPNARPLPFPPTHGRAAHAAL